MIRFNPIKTIWILILLLSFTGNVAGMQVAKRDTVSLQQIQVPAKSLKRYKGAKSFTYVQERVNPGFGDRLWAMLREWFGYRYISVALPWIFYSLLIIAFVLVVVVLFRSNFQGIFLRNNSDSGLDIKPSEIDNAIDFEQLLNEALRDKNYNLAVRYLYLIVLRHLSQKNMITYRPGKTNFEYLSEISNSSIVHLFREVTHDYEYAWYGQFPIDENEYRTIESGYKNINEKLND